MGFVKSKRRSLWRFILFITLQGVLGAGAPINLNFKSGLLSRLLGNSPATEKDSGSFRDSGSATSKERSKGRVSLDLSGCYHCLVAGPRTDPTVEGAPIPLFSSGVQTKGWSPPSLILSAQYNFSQAWYGATRLISSLQWSYQRDDPKLAKNNKVAMPFTVKLKSEKGLTESDDYAAELDVSWKGVDPDRNPPNLSLRWAPTCSQVAIAAPLLQRVDFVWKSLFLQRRPSSGHFSSQFIPSPQEDWWIPILKINTAGRLTSRNQAGFLVGKKRRVGVRLVLSRQLGWSAFGGTPISDVQETLMRLEVTGMDDRAESFSTVTMETALERIRTSTHWTLTHEQVHIL